MKPEVKEYRTAHTDIEATPYAHEENLSADAICAPSPPPIPRAGLLFERSYETNRQSEQQLFVGKLFYNVL